ncbi:MAG: AbrB family transcriptional regulator [Candidatus Schekmanbacteria bacterium RIFCSPHIGHO2_02_FULL_38_11]|uniref:AbrB family transcriptional regulator n=1 Tax=Candidatus Schekmanbacteria bacterium RIFCSPLOWO2_12_FULL_38_15 TaxID=1817883 RepID=A0A1F7SFM0_9BACT|nr:MAG: AbrB family transcriptional regulator [Candidatus Schekmanbacteria bacterium GWA2_38_9]OGL49380.1 MAG: AbrB family transcriptional regulator [Candidatus Schekmanbacteria bacterium RIFCSPLOWO2_02_FULL_38_14]OGL52301.1 MAG: AbrB family transcriptional regulator [Candidatus Schekmanbacteria bacterium RIFCSPHIGHO2_02_FULL_38_11]OGL52606.1 MAG: AbrB family transcriptional regulator [Candidatus Schekmanbacteria bacterium RIFCSPLOWO2_12_FULL_38_15]
MLAKKTSKNQITLPKEIAKTFPDTKYFDVSVKDKKIILIPVKIIPAYMTLEGIREKIEKLGIAEEDVTRAVEWARKKNAKKDSS